METNEKTVIRIRATVDKAIEIVWKCWITPEDIVRWNNASEDWYTPRAQNDLQVDGTFNYRMEARDGSFGFDFSGIYSNVIPNKLIEYTMDDGRKVSIQFNPLVKGTEITESFEAEEINPVEMQRIGWQSILNNFKRYTENMSLLKVI